MLLGTAARFMDDNNKKAQTGGGGATKSVTVI